MMSLVDYGSGSSDESEEEVEHAVQILPQKSDELQSPASCTRPTVQRQLDPSVDNNIKEHLFCTSAAASNSFLKGLPKPKYGLSESSINEEGQSKSGSGSSLFASLPKPKRDVFNIQNNEGTLASSRGSKTVKITVPSLSQFKDNDDSEPVKKKPKPSSKGSGLFSLLPPPKYLTVKETKRSLVPHVLTKKTPAPPVKTVPPATVILTKPSLELISHGYPDSGDDSEEGENAGDFFSLNTNDDLAEMEESTVSTSSINLTEEILEPESELIKDEPLAFVSGFQPSAWKTQTNPTTAGAVWPSSAEQSTSQEFSEADDYLSVVEDDLQLDDEALQRLCGRRAKKKDMEFINVSGAELMPDPKEWLVKQLSQEQPTMRSHSHKKNDGPTSQQRRKHQITYLAFQAKENELELKNQWSQNKMSRKQTQSKYGF